MLDILFSLEEQLQQLKQQATAEYESEENCHAR